LSEVLAKQSGIVVNDYGPQGQLKTVSIRGSTSSQVLILLDGIRLNSSFDGSVDFSQIPTDNIDHIEIVRGGDSSLWGTGAVGGVINIITKKADKSSLDLKIANGSYIPHDGYAITETGSSFEPASATNLFDNQNVNLSFASKLGDFGVTGGGSLTRAMNAFVWDDSANSGDWRQRNNAQDIAQSAYAGLQFPLLNGSLSTKGTFTHSLAGVPGQIFVPAADYASSEASQEDTSAIGAFAYDTSHFFTDSLNLDIKGSYRYWQETYNNPLYPPESVHTTNSASLDLTQRLSLPGTISAIYGGSSTYEVANSTDFADQKTRLTLAGFLSLPLSPLQPLTVTPSIRYDYYSDFPGYLSYQVAAVLLLTETTSLKASFGSAYRVPTFEELYWYEPGIAMGNPNLQPETSYSGEIGIASSSKRFSLETSVFTRLVFNQIDWNYYLSPATPVNISESLLPGAEINATVNITDQISLETNYTFIYSILLEYLGQNYQITDNVRVPFVPVHNLCITGRYKNGIHRFDIELQYVSEKFTDPGDTSSLALSEYVVANAGYSADLSKNFVFSLTLRNIFNELYYTEPGYPMPPFSIVTSVEAKL